MADVVSTNVSGAVSQKALGVNFGMLQEPVDTFIDTIVTMVNADDEVPFRHFMQDEFRMAIFERVLHNVQKVKKSGAELGVNDFKGIYFGILSNLQGLVLGQFDEVTSKRKEELEPLYTNFVEECIKNVKLIAPDMVETINCNARTKVEFKKKVEGVESKMRENGQEEKADLFRREFLMQSELQEKLFSKGK